MKIGYCVQGFNDDQLLHGLRDKLCPQVELVRISRRGRSLKRSEVKGITAEASQKQVSALIFLTDVDDVTANEVRQNDSAMLAQLSVRWVLGIADRNVESWYCADVDYISNFSDLPTRSFAVADHKNIFYQALNLSSHSEADKARLREFVVGANLRQWANTRCGSRSFRQFYQDLRALGQALGCALPNL